MRTLYFSFFALTAFSCISTNAQALDCAKAQSRAELAVCGDLVLQVKDADLSKIYFAKLKSLASDSARHDALQKEQRVWLKQRDDQCGKKSDAEFAACLKASMDERIQTLRAEAPAPTPAAASPAAPTQNQAPDASGQGASFDCAKARGAIETSICGDKDLQKKDREASKLFFDVLHSAPDKSRHDALLGEQRKWLAHRSALCLHGSQSSLSVCIGESLSQRIAALRSLNARAGKRELSIGDKVKLGGKTLVFIAERDRFGHEMALKYEDRVLLSGDAQERIKIEDQWTAPDVSALLVNLQNKNFSCADLSLIENREGKIEVSPLGVYCNDAFDPPEWKRTDFGLKIIQAATPIAEGKETFWDMKSGAILKNKLEFHPVAGSTMAKAFQQNSAALYEPLTIEDFYRAANAIARADRDFLLQALWRMKDVRAFSIEDFPSKKLFNVKKDNNGVAYSGCGLTQNHMLLSCDDTDALAIWLQSDGRFYFALAPHNDARNHPNAAEIHAYPPLKDWPQAARDQFELWRSGASWIQE